MKENTTFDDFCKMDIRIGTIVSVEAVPKSTKLLKFEISFGPEIGNRIILSGIAPLLEAGSSGPGTYVIIGQKVLAVVNFPPRAMMGIESHGMLLSVKDNEGRFWLTSPGSWADDGIAVG